MQLDELKILWNADSDPDPFDRGTLRQMLGARRQTAMGKIRRNIWTEILLLVVLAAATLSWFMLRSLPVHWAEWVLFSLLFPANGLLYWYKVKVFVQREDVAENLTQSLDSYIQKLDSYLQMYQVIMAFMVPILSTVGIFYGFTIARVEDGKGFEDLPWQIYPILAVVTIVYIFVAMKFTKWYMKKLYGDHLAELKVVSSELQETLAEA